MTGHGVAFGEHQPVGAGVPGVLGVVPHHAVHQRRRSGAPATGALEGCPLPASVHILTICLLSLMTLRSRSLYSAISCSQSWGGLLSQQSHGTQSDTLLTHAPAENNH